MGYRLLVHGECPWVPSSMGKVVLWLAKELAQMGHEVLVSCLGAPTATLFSRKFVYNPREQCDEEKLCDLLPDIDIPVVNPRRGMLVADAIKVLGGLDAIVVYGSHHAGAIGEWINDEVRQTWTSIGRPAIAYHQLDTPYESPYAALSVASYSAAAYPSRFSRDTAVNAVASLLGSSAAEEFARYTAVVYHGIDVGVYNEKTAERFRDSRARDRSYRIVSFVSKNHPRKDYGSLVRCVAKLKKMGFNVYAGLYFVDAVAVPVWDANRLTSFAKMMEGVDVAVVTVPQPARAYGLTEGELIDFYVNWTDVHAYMSRGESFGIPPLESVMLGIPTVVSGIPPQREIWGDTLPMVEVREFLVDSWVALSPDPESCAKVCAEVLAKGMDLSRARERVLSMFTSRHMAEQLLKALEIAFEDPAPIALKVRVIGEAIGVTR
jgi:Glycosyltransferase